MPIKNEEKNKEKLMKSEDPPKENVDTNRIKIVTTYITRILQNSFKYSQYSEKRQVFREDDIELAQ